ncbi:efflux RND transporter periplasmic adaptor subunit [Pseudomonas sp. MOB-449]|nr:efflux RND transporter periplasmic adaptor subunit [Pseudomonas sp. MOB-449]
MRAFWKAAVLSGLSIGVGLVAGYWYGQKPGADLPTAMSGPGKASGERPVLYWYDPMYPQQKFDQPGQSPFMDMALVPRYADDTGGSAATTVSIDPGLSQNLGLRVAPVTRAPLASSLEVAGVLAFDERHTALVQARTGGFVERVYARAPGDVLQADAPLADLLVPDWAAAQEEFLALKGIGDRALLEAARQRLRLAGMPASLIARIERSGRAEPVLTIRAPIGGVLQELNLRTGMAVTRGDTLARMTALGSIWLRLAVPEADAGAVAVGQAVEARLAAFPGEVLTGVVDAVLPEANLDSRTVQVRIELPNPGGRLRPGMTAQASLKRATGEAALWVPTEAVIRTGRRSLVMLAEDAGRYRPVDVRTGPEHGSQTLVLQGLEEGQQVVASGQFLLDSEASLKGLGMQPPMPEKASVLHEADAQVLAIDNAGVTLAHGPFTSLNMPGMTMTFPLADPALKVGIQAGDKVRVAVRQSDAGLVVERLEKLGGQP